MCNIHLSTSIYIYIHIFISIYIYLDMYIYINICILICKYIYILCKKIRICTRFMSSVSSLTQAGFLCL